MEAIGQLTGGIAHDFNNLLHGIDGSVSIAKRRLSAGRYEDIGEWLDTALVSTRKAAALTQRLLAFSRRQPLSPTTVHAGRLVREMNDLLTRTLGEAVVITIATADDLWHTQCDANQLESAILNLAINGRDAMPDGGTLKIEMGNLTIAGVDTAGQEGIEPGDYVCITVADSGCGMAPATISQAFEPFFTTKPVGQGTGLGLSTVYGFARQSKGYAKIASAPDQGTSISVYLPRFAGSIEPLHEPIDQDAPEAPVNASDKTIVVIEDEPGVRFVVVSFLEDLGYHPIEAADGISGLEIVQKLPQIDLLITDIGLPGMNGRQVAEAARLAHPELKVVFMTGYADKVGAGSAPMTSGMQMITKPFTLDALAGAVSGML